MSNILRVSLLWKYAYGIALSRNYAAGHYRIAGAAQATVSGDAGQPDCHGAASDYFHVTLGELIRKTLPVALLFCALMIGYYELLLLI